MSASLKCEHCEALFVQLNYRQRFCSDQCRNRAKDMAKRFPCRICGELMWAGRTVVGPGVSAHNACMSAASGGKVRTSITQFICARCGVEVTRPHTKGMKPKWCLACRPPSSRSSKWATAAMRLSVYERDEWTCQICSGRVDASLRGTTSIWAPSLDHITPRSQGGTNNLSNLRLAHHWCNSVLCDGRTYADSDFVT